MNARTIDVPLTAAFCVVPLAQAAATLPQRTMGALMGRRIRMATCKWTGPSTLSIYGRPQPSRCSDSSSGRVMASYGEDGRPGASGRAVVTVLATIWINPFSTGGTPQLGGIGADDRPRRRRGGGLGPVTRVGVPVIATVVLGAIGVGFAALLARSERLRAILRASFRGRHDSGVTCDVPRDERRGDRRGEIVAGDNGLYRAWSELTEELDVPDPDVAMSRELAEIAEQAGLLREDVRELTRLFEDVRYDGHPPTEDRHRRAANTVRRI